MIYIATIKNLKDGTKRKIKINGRGTTGAITQANTFCVPGEVVHCITKEDLTYMYVNPNDAEYE